MQIIDTITHHLLQYNRIWFNCFIIEKVNYKKLFNEMKETGI